MAKFSLGPVAKSQLARISLMWEQGQHVLITGGTGSGKTRLARELIQMRLDRGGSVVVFVAKLQRDDTLRDDYGDFKRWKTWKDRPSVTDRRILLWPDVEGKTATEARAILQAEYSRALNEISKVGKWTVVIDEGLYTTASGGLNQSEIISQMFQLIRSAKGTMIVLAQRPAHLPLAIFANIDMAFVSRASETMDLKRLGDLSTVMPSKKLQAEIARNGKHDFVWIPTGWQLPPERINLAK